MQRATTARMQGLVGAFVLLSVAVTGCLGTADDEPSPADDVVDDEQPAGTPHRVDDPGDGERIPFRFPLEAPVDDTARMEGVFAWNDTGVAGGFVTGRFVHAVDLTHLVPADIPTRVEVTVTLDSAEVPIAGPTARADPVSNDTVWYESNWRNPAAGHYEMTAIVKRASEGTLGIALEAYTSGPDDPPDVAYVVQANVTALPDAVPVGVPVAFTLQANETVTLQTAEGNQAELLVYGPGDRLLDRLFLVGTDTWTVPRGQGGELVVVPILGAADLRILYHARDNATAPVMRALDLDRETGQRHEIATMDVTSWTFDVDGRPLRVVLTVLGPAGAPWTCMGSLDVILSAPDGPILERTTDCPSPTNVPFLYEERRTWTSHTGDALLVPGSYSVEVDNTLWSGHEAFHMVERYVR